jgi:tyrosyl-tRNA synthetase
VRLAREIISWLHSPAAAEEAEAAFRRQFVEKQVPTDMPEVSIGPGPHRLAALLVKAGLATSNGEATRKVKEGAVDVDQQRVTEFNKEYLVERPMVLRLGRRFARVLP